MVELAGHYDEAAEPSADFGAIPSGEYEAEIIDSSIDDISKKENKGKCLLLVWKIIVGDYANRQVWQRLNLWPENFKSKDPAKKSDEEVLQEAINIANSQFASVRQATVKMPGESSEMHNIPCIIRVELVQQQGYRDKNEVKHVKATDASAPKFSPPPGAGSRAPQASSNPAPAGGGKSAPTGSAPWRKTA